MVVGLTRFPRSQVIGITIELPMIRYATAFMWRHYLLQTTDCYPEMVEYRCWWGSFFGLIQIMMTYALQRRLKSSHIRVFALHPGLIVSDLNRCFTDSRFYSGVFNFAKNTGKESSWWRHQNGNIFRVTDPLSPVTGEFPSQRPVTRSFDAFFDLRLNKRLKKHSRRWWFEMPSRLLWRHCND